MGPYIFGSWDAAVVSGNSARYIYFVTTQNLQIPVDNSRWSGLGIWTTLMVTSVSHTWDQPSQWRKLLNWE